MEKRGRKSAASLATTAIGAPVITRYLAAPKHLSDAEMGVWNQVVGDQPAEAFSATHAPLLELYCRHVVQARVLADELSHFERTWLATDDGLKRYDRLLGMSERESRAASSLATRLRLTRQAVEHPTTVGRQLRSTPKTKKPWELAA